MTPRELINHCDWERRFDNCKNDVNAFLAKHKLEVEPDYTEAWTDFEITLKHKTMATTKSVNPDGISDEQFIKLQNMDRFFAQLAENNIKNELK